MSYFSHFNLYYNVLLVFYQILSLYYNILMHPTLFSGNILEVTLNWCFSSLLVMPQSWYSGLQCALLA